MSNPDPNARYEILEELERRAELRRLIDAEDVAAAARRVKSGLYIGSAFVADAKRVARAYLAVLELQ